MTSPQPWHHNTPEGRALRAAAIEAAPRGVWLCGMPSPQIDFWPRRLPSTGLPIQAAYPCRCAEAPWACRRGTQPGDHPGYRCACNGREKSLSHNDRPTGYGELLPSPLWGLPVSCCAIVALLSGG